MLEGTPAGKNTPSIPIHPFHVWNLYLGSILLAVTVDDDGSVAGPVKDIVMCLFTGPGLR